MTFVLFHIVGGDPALHFAGKNADPQMIQKLKVEMGLDKPLVLQYLAFLKRTLVFDWGHSWVTSEPVYKMFLSGLIPSALVTLPAFLISLCVSMGLALISAYKKSIWDRGIVMGSLVSLSISFLVYIVLLQKWLAFDLGLFPVYGWESSFPWPYLFLPWIIYILATTGPKTLLFRSTLLDEVKNDYTQTARAKGLSDWQVLKTHVFKNSLLPIVTISMSQIPNLLMGSLLLESYFGIPGLGGMLANAIHSSDFPVIQAFTVVGALLYILVNALNDIFCAYLDPRWEIQ